MSLVTDTAPAPPADPYIPVGRRHHDPLPAPELRGDLTIADGVVQKIAAAALGEVTHLGGAARRVLGLALGSDEPEELPRVTATVSGGSAVLDVAASVAYPAPVTPTTDRARAHVIDRVGVLTGLTVARVDITVTALTTPESASRRRELA